MPPWAWELFDCSAPFCNDDDRQFRIDRQRRAKPGQSAADHEHVGEEMRHVLRMERNEITRNVCGHGSFDFLVTTGGRTFCLPPFIFAYRLCHPWQTRMSAPPVFSSGRPIWDRAWRSFGHGAALNHFYRLLGGGHGAGAAWASIVTSKRRLSPHQCDYAAFFLLERFRVRIVGGWLQSGS